ncbi:hypothetical protein D0863_05243 [Hortaea werneckii]|uniref:Oxidoreductase molybdopterin-binding domain-containing protein n=1 Tax=Hortaea werneckii TaxID=91943 RepID=A0A3M7E4C1_HORWE|nr:hypothetical protein D0863_05243 [Hortaea werneckii]
MDLLSSNRTGFNSTMRIRRPSGKHSQQTCRQISQDPGIVSHLPDSAYDRNHGVLAYLNAATHRVRVDGAVNQTLDLSLSDLQTAFPQSSVVCTIQCAGNRRTHDAEPAPRSPRPELARRRDHEQPKDGTPGSATSRPKPTASRSALPSQATAHVAFACYTAPCEDESWYGASIPLARALREDGEVLLATAMDGCPADGEPRVPCPRGSAGDRGSAGGEVGG